MTSPAPEAALRPFNPSGYEILDDGAGAEVVIWSNRPVAPRLDDVLLIERRGRPYDARVTGLQTIKKGWIARCRLSAA